MIHVRRATLEDLDSVCAMLDRHVKACANHFPAPDKAVLAHTILSSFHHTSPLLGLVAEMNGEIIGIACAIASRYLWADKIQAEIRIIYVSPEHRGSRAFSLLMECVEQWAAEKNAVEISFTLATGNVSADERVSSALLRRAWKKSGVDLIKSTCTE